MTETNKLLQPTGTKISTCPGSSRNMIALLISVGHKWQSLDMRNICMQMHTYYRTHKSNVSTPTKQMSPLPQPQP